MRLLDGYKIKLNLKAACDYEHLTGKPYVSNMGVMELLMLFYCVLAANNQIDFTHEIFLKMLEDKKVAGEVMDALEKLLNYQSQYQSLPREKEVEEKKEKEEDRELWITDVANYLIINMGMDAHYVMFDMDLWEIEDLMKKCDAKTKDDLIEKRLFTFLEMSPLRLGKSVKEPKDVLPFPWEKEESKKMDNNEAKRAFAFLNKARKDG